MIVALVLADDAGVRLGGEVAHRRRNASDSGGPGRCASFMPCCTTAHSPSRSDDERVQIDLEAVGDGVVVDARGQAAGAHQRLAVEAAPFGNGAQLVGRVAGVPAASAADVDAKLVRRAGSGRASARP